jgi:hypothetical protein
MQEYKRERNTLEEQLNEMTKRSTFHDDHLRIIDAWWKQVSVFVALPSVPSGAFIRLTRLLL